MEDKSRIFEVASKIKLSPVLSSNIRGIGYNDENKILAVLFINGSKYIYENVEPEVFNLVRNSESVGRALNECIVRNKDKYRYYKIV